jgi:hypothetical protein
MEVIEDVISIAVLKMIKVKQHERMNLHSMLKVLGELEKYIA